MAVNSAHTTYVLYGTSACHLCEVAEELLNALNDQGLGLAFEKVDISDSDELFERYGVRIPVLAYPGGDELGWPFTAEDVVDFLSRPAP